MIFSVNQLIYILINVLLVGFGAGLTALSIKILKLKEKSSILLFILYIIYWVAPLVTRDYTGLIQIHMDVKNEVLLFIPLVCYGIIGLIYRPLSDVFALKFKSRKNVIYISLVLQFLMALPMFIYPCFETNIVQSIGAGIGASCIGLFNLMFNEHEYHNSLAKRVSILVLPPLIAQFIASGFICINVSIVHATHTGVQYVDIVRYLWLIAIIMIVACFVITPFIKEKGEILHKKSVNKQIVKSGKDWWILILLCVCAMFICFAKWVVGGATASVQIAYIANKTGVDTRAYEGYASLVGSVGQLIGVIISTVWLEFDHKTPHIRIYLLLIATIIGLTYFAISSIWVNIPMFISSAILNGISYGIFTNVLLGIIITGVFSRKKLLITPVGIYNTALAIGIVGGTFANCFIKQGIFDQMHGFSTYSFANFKEANLSVGILGAIATLLAFVCFIIARGIHKTNKKAKRIRVKKQVVVTSDTEM